MRAKLALPVIVSNYADDLEAQLGSLRLPETRCTKRGGHAIPNSLTQQRGRHDASEPDTKRTVKENGNTFPVSLVHVTVQLQRKFVIQKY